VTAGLLSPTAALSWRLASILSPVLARRYSPGPVQLVQHVVSAIGSGLLLLVAAGHHPPVSQLLAGLAADICTAMAAAAAFALGSSGPVRARQ
jgi:hypothetical protein